MLSISHTQYNIHVDYVHTDAMNETFLLSNIVPQDANNNAGFWNRLEIYCRDLSAKYDHVWVISGPVFLPTVGSDKGKTKKIMHHEVIGSHEVAVPTHLFKVVVVENDKDMRPFLAAFVVPNEPIANERVLREFQVPLEYVESHTGLHMLPSLNRQKACDLCTVDSCRIKTWQEFQLYFTGKRIENARTQNQLEKVWKEVVDKELQSNKQLVAAYDNKQNELRGTVASSSTRAQG